MVSAKAFCLAETPICGCTGSSNQQLAVQAAELQGQVGSYESFTELCIQELRRLSMLAGEPFQLPALPPPAQVLLFACAEHALLLSYAS